MRLFELASARFVESSAKINAKIASRTEHTLTSQISIDFRKVFLFLGFVRLRKFRMWERHCDEKYAEGEGNHFAKRLQLRNILIKLFARTATFCLFADLSRWLLLSSRKILMENFPATLQKGNFLFLIELQSTSIHSRDSRDLLPHAYSAVLWPTSNRLIYLSTTRSSDFMLIASGVFWSTQLAPIKFPSLSIIFRWHACWKFMNRSSVHHTYGTSTKAFRLSIV